MAIYMNYNSLAVKGDATEAGHTGWITLNSCQWGVGRGISAPVGSAVNREASHPSISEITVSKMLDAGSTKLLTEALVGEGVPCQIDFCKTEKDKLVVYLTLTLTNTMISGYSLSSGGDKPSESVSLNFTKIEFKNFPMDSTGKVGAADPVAYDLGLAAKA
jgi:type VI secretion system secreted protein Hcp